MFEGEKKPCAGLVREKNTANYDSVTHLSKKIELLDSRKKEVVDRCEGIEIGDLKNSIEPEITFENYELSMHNISSIKEATQVARDLGVLSGSNIDIYNATKNVREAFSTFTREYGVKTKNIQR